MSGSKFEMAYRQVAFIAVKSFEGKNPRGIYTALSISECVDYNCVKDAIFKAYELVSDVYHQNIINKKLELAHEKEVYLDIWCNSRKIGAEFEKIRQVILTEKFKRCV